MSRLSAKDESKRRSIRLLSCLFGSLILASSVGAGQAQTAAVKAPAQLQAGQPTTYRVINLRAGDLTEIPVFNSSGQAVFSLFDGTDIPRAWFYDGTAIQDIGTLGGPGAYVTGINNAGQVAGFSALGADPTISHAFVWSPGNGIHDLGSLAASRPSYASAINNRGQVAGVSIAPDGALHPFRWSAAGGMEDLGTFPGSSPIFTSTTAINDGGLVAGWSNTATDDPHAFAWTRRTGLVDLGTLGGSESYAVAVDAVGRVAGYSLTPSFVEHAFIWSRSSGMQDIGTAGGSGSSVVAMSTNGHVTGGINFPNGEQHAFSWTRASGMVDLGTLGGADSIAHGVNNKGQLVGGSSTTNGQLHAFVWTVKEGMVDLNQRLKHAPAGLVLDFAVAISDKGWILATSNAGLVLLKPDRPDCGCAGHTAGPIEAADMVEIGAPFDTAVSFANADKAAKHNVIWSWGDGSGDQAGNARASNGAGSASGSHAYTTPGIYTVTANVTDLAGKSVAVSRTIVAVDWSGSFAGGSGSFMSPQGANKKSRIATGKASFSFIAPSIAGAKSMAAKPQLRFHVTGLSFRSETITPVAGQGARGQFEGSGTINGKGDYKFTLDTTAGATAGQGEPARFGLRIWHINPTTMAEVLDYDNTGPGAAGATILEGRIAVQQ